MTNAEKFKAVFGFELKNIGSYEDGYYCIDSDADIECKTCPLYEKGCSHVDFINWWQSEYQGEPTKTDLISKEEALELFPLILSGELLPIGTVREQLRKLQTVEAVALSVIEDIKAEIEESRYIDKDTRLVENANSSGLSVALEIIDKAVKECTHE